VKGIIKKMSTEPENNNIFFFCVIAQGSVPCFFKKSKNSHNSHFENKCISIITSQGDYSKI